MHGSRHRRVDGAKALLGAALVAVFELEKRLPSVGVRFEACFQPQKTPDSLVAPVGHRWSELARPALSAPKDRACLLARAEMPTSVNPQSPDAPGEHQASDDSLQDRSRIQNWSTLKAADDHCEADASGDD